MPNFDAGTYFLTILAPVKPGIIQESISRRHSSWDAKFTDALVAAESKSFEGYEPDDTAQVSWAQRLRAVLATLPTALQSPATIDIGVQSPFARNTRNHLCRFAVIENVIYNGRTPADPILGGLPLIGKFFGGKGNLLVVQKVDNLTRPYLMFAADFDAVVEDGASLPTTLNEDEQDRIRDSYLAKLWDTASEELQAVFENCVGFENVKDAASFAGFMAKCQVETTMPFHDYWTTPPDIKSLPIPLILAVVAVPALVFVMSALCWLVGIETLFLLGWSSGFTAVAAALLTGVSVGIIYRWVISNGNKPFPPARRGDLPSVLKALYLQQNFADFVIANQGAKPADLHKAFGDFIISHKPDNKSGPTQKPGCISSNKPGSVQQ